MQFAEIVKGDIRRLLEEECGHFAMPAPQVTKHNVGLRRQCKDAPQCAIMNNNRGRKGIHLCALD
jgi:hypothetical protein